MRIFLGTIGFTLIVLGAYMNLRGKEKSEEKRIGGWLFFIGFLIEVIMGVMYNND